MDLAILESRRHESSNGPFKPIPKFKNEDEERKFWATHDTTKYVDWKSARRVRFPNLKPASKRRHRAA
ncbi:MAG: hypothetical protein HYZ94_02435 [Candidatus Omnitrophica bacterium]|nr:hypothetical protein [Candidatus Omnitrophota bacterium]